MASESADEKKARLEAERLQKEQEQAARESEARDAEAAKQQADADQAVTTAEAAAAAADSQAFQADATASTEALIARDPARQVPYTPLPVQVAPAPPAQDFRQVRNPKTGAITNEGIGAKE